MIMDFYFTDRPECDWCGKVDPYIPIGFTSDTGYMCPVCAFSDCRISADDLDRIDDRIKGMRKMYLVYQTLKSQKNKSKSASVV